MPAARTALLLTVAAVCVPWKNRSVNGCRPGKYLATVSASVNGTITVSLLITAWARNVPSRSTERFRSTRPSRSAWR